MATNGPYNHNETNPQMSFFVPTMQGHGCEEQIRASLNAAFPGCKISIDLKTKHLSLWLESKVLEEQVIDEIQKTGHSVATPQATLNQSKTDIGITDQNNNASCFVETPISCSGCIEDLTQALKDLQLQIEFSENGFNARIPDGRDHSTTAQAIVNKIHDIGREATLVFRKPIAANSQKNPSEHAPLSSKKNKLNT